MSPWRGGDLRARLGHTCQVGLSAATGSAVVGMPSRPRGKEAGREGVPACALLTAREGPWPSACPVSFPCPPLALTGSPVNTSATYHPLTIGRSEAEGESNSCHHPEPPSRCSGFQAFRLLPIQSPGSGHVRWGTMTIPISWRRKPRPRDTK